MIVLYLDQSQNVFIHVLLVFNFKLRFTTKVVRYLILMFIPICKKNDKTFQKK